MTVSNVQAASAVLFEAVVSGQAYNLNDGSLCWLEAADGLGMAPLHRITDRGPMQHGEMDTGFRLDPRQIKLVLGIDGASAGDKYDKRKRLLAIFYPRSTPLKLRWTFPDGAVRQIDAFYVGDMSMPTVAGRGYTESIGVSLNCPDPTYYDPRGEALSFGMGAGSASFTVPSPVPTAVGTSTVDHYWGLRYDGTWLTYPSVIRIQGPIADPVLANETTGEKLDFTGTSIAAGDAYYIDCTWGRKTVQDAAGANRIAQLTADSHLATFHIAPDDEAPGGYNTLRVTGDGANDQTRVDLVYFTRYIGF